ncbi:hypothetical protein N780_06870 [Pontibacillus chungwhensis BH030062]|uniref:DUF2164 domain-containing protein n=1 Tax=Pontibacillus chungwhensis BH030062 TaxID=1385513 RepID=A0A0A2UP86_9BACI|nr:DUF2164 domain-containing protein [Pontibacillus chungwhensis]KGP90107.1 hypothetical protein N780_06870 [Pontibacillus chungwhensis BH030062]
MKPSLKKEEREQILSKIQGYFEMERGEEIGTIAADQVFQFIEKEVAPHFYNQGVRDAKRMLEEKMMNLDEDITSLEKPTYPTRR